MFFDVSYIDTHLYVPTKFGEPTTTYIKFSNSFPDYLDMDLFITAGTIPDYKGYNCNANLFATLIHNRLYLRDFYTGTAYLNQGYGSALFCSFLITAAKLKENYPIKYTKGELVPKDFDYWQYSIHLYSKANEYCERYSIPLRLSSCVNGKYSFKEFLHIYQAYKDSTVDFIYSISTV